MVVPGRGEAKSCEVFGIVNHDCGGGGTCKNELRRRGAPKVIVTGSGLILLYLVHPKQTQSSSSEALIEIFYPVSIVCHLPCKEKLKLLAL